MPELAEVTVKVDLDKLAVRDYLLAQLAAINAEINRLLILESCRQLSASGKSFLEIKEGYWPQHMILRRVHEMTGLDHLQLPGGDLIAAIYQLTKEGVLDHITHREDDFDKWRNHDCYRIAADY